MTAMDDDEFLEANFYNVAPLAQSPHLLVGKRVMVSGRLALKPVVAGGGGDSDCGGGGGGGEGDGAR